MYEKKKGPPLALSEVVGAVDGMGIVPALSTTPAIIPITGYLQETPAGSLPLVLATGVFTIAINSIYKVDASVVIQLVSALVETLAPGTTVTFGLYNTTTPGTPEDAVTVAPIVLSTGLVYGQNVPFLWTGTLTPGTYRMQVVITAVEPVPLLATGTITDAQLSVVRIPTDPPPAPQRRYRRPQLRESKAPTPLSVADVKKIGRVTSALSSASTSSSSSSLFGFRSHPTTLPTNSKEGTTSHYSVTTKT